MTPCRLALLNNRELQAIYSDLGVAQADLVQAGLLKNPLFDASIRWPTPGGGKPELDLSAVVSFLDIFYLPLRKRVAAARFEEAKTRVSGSVMDFAARVRTAFLAHQTNEQMLELRQTILQALTASFEVSRRLQEAGNIADLDFARERALLEGGKLTLRSVEVAVRQSREELNILMGLWGNRDGVANRSTFARSATPISPDGGYRTRRAQSQFGPFECPATSRGCRRTVGIQQVDCSRFRDARWRGWRTDRWFMERRPDA